MREKGRGERGGGGGRRGGWYQTSLWLFPHRKSTIDDQSSITTHIKRSSYDETNSKNRLETHPEGDYKASSLPRSTKIATAAKESKEGKLDRTEGRVAEQKGKVWSEEKFQLG